MKRHPHLPVFVDERAEDGSGSRADVNPHLQPVFPTSDSFRGPESLGPWGSL